VAVFKERATLGPGVRKKITLNRGKGQSPPEKIPSAEEQYSSSNTQIHAATKEIKDAHLCDPDNIYPQKK